MNNKFWLLAVLFALVITFVAICKKQSEVKEQEKLQEQIYNHSEITEKTLNE